jgi:putative tryptophan/tyrosine transport system substrate-binding protein
MLPSIGGYRAAAPSHHDLCSVAFITNIAGFEFSVHTAVRLGLKDAGFVDGQNMRVEARWADGHFERILPIMREFVSLRAAAIVGNSTAIAAGRATVGDTPVIFVAGDDPVKAGHVASLNRPGGTLTGVSFYDVPLAGKRLGLLLDLVPASASIAVLVDPDFAPFEEELTSLEAAARPIKRQLTIFRATNEREIEAAFTAIAKSGAGGVHVGSGPMFNTHRQKIVRLAAQHKLPASYSLRGFADVGGLMSYRCKSGRCLLSCRNLCRKSSQGRETGPVAGRTAGQI